MLQSIDYLPSKMNHIVVCNHRWTLPSYHLALLLSIHVHLMQIGFSIGFSLAHHHSSNEKKIREYWKGIHLEIYLIIYVRLFICLCNLATCSKCPARLVIFTTLAPGRKIGNNVFATYLANKWNGNLLYLNSER